MEHVYEKIINLDNESQTTSSSANDKPGEQEKDEDMAMLAEEKIELMCQDHVGGASIDPPLLPSFLPSFHSLPSSFHSAILSRAPLFSSISLLFHFLLGLLSRPPPPPFLYFPFQMMLIAVTVASSSFLKGLFLAFLCFIIE